MVTAVSVSLVWTLIWLIPLSPKASIKPAAIARVFGSLNLTLNFDRLLLQRKFAFANEARSAIR
jgi:hypothetical protein